MSSPVPWSPDPFTSALSQMASRSPARSIAKRTTRSLEHIESRTLIRAASVQAEALIQAQKLHEIDYLTQKAMSGEALLHQWQGTLAQGDPILGANLDFYKTMARLGKGEIIADTITTFSREGQR